MKTNRIDKTFYELREKNEKALVGFVTAGDPSIEDSFKIIESMCKNGLDILELGVPFSDPTADGPLIQRSSKRALANGITLKGVLELSSRIREITSIPIILFSYYNPIHAYGAGKIYKSAISSGADGILIVDLPPEESDEMLSLWEISDLAFIRLIAPTTPSERISQIADQDKGFLYLVSKTGVTGSDGLDINEIKKKIEVIRDRTILPICVGFGISTASDVKMISSVADGVVIGSAFEKLIEQNLNNLKILPSLIREKVREFKKKTVL